MSFQILTDGLSDLPAFWLRQHKNVTVIDTPVTVTGPDLCEVYNHMSADDFMELDELVRKRGARTMTSQPRVRDPFCEDPESVESIARGFMANGTDVVYLAMSSTLSGTYGTITMLFRELNEEYGGRAKAHCIDTTCASTGLALLIMELFEAMEAGEVETIGQIGDFVQKNRGFIGHYFTWANLDYIRNSGRVNVVEATAAKVLGLRLIGCNILTDSDERRLEVLNRRALFRGISKWGDFVGEYAAKHITDPCGRIIVAHGNSPRDAEIIVERMKRFLPNAQYLYGHEWRCGAAIQCHGGPSSIHVNFHIDSIEHLSYTSSEFAHIIKNKH